MKTGTTFFLLCAALSLSATGAEGSCAVVAGWLIGPPRETAPPWPEGVGEGMSRLGPTVRARMGRLFREVGHRPFSPAFYAAFLGLGKGRASADIRKAFLAGGLKRGRELNTYEFRKGWAPGGWQSFYEYGDSESASVLARAYGLFEEGAFPFGEFAKQLGLPRHKAKQLLGDGVLSGVIVRGQGVGSYAFVAAPLDPEDLPKRASFLEGIGLPPEIWHRAHLLDGAVFARLRHFFGSMPPGRIFGESEYGEMMRREVARDVASMEIRAGVLVGIIRRAEDADGAEAFAFATEPGPTGLEAFFEYGPEAYGVVQGLNGAFGRFGRRPFSREELMEGVDGDDRGDYEAMLREGLLAGVLIKGEDGTFSFADSFEIRLVPHKRIQGIPRRAYDLLRRAGIPLDVWGRAHLLGQIHVERLVDALEEFGDRPFGFDEGARAMGVGATVAKYLLRWASLAGLVERRENLYAFRKNAVSGGWVMFYGFGNTALATSSETLPNLERAFGRFGRGPFTLGQSLEVFEDLSVRVVRRILREGLLADVLRREGEDYVFTADPPTQWQKEVLVAGFSLTVVEDVPIPVVRDIPPDIYALLDELGIPRVVWRRAHLLGETLLARMGRALGTYRLDPFDVAGYCDLAGIRPEMGAREVRLAVLAGVLQRGSESGSYVFRREADAGGWAAFSGYGGLGIQRSERYLGLALGIFGDTPFTAAEIIEKTGTDDISRMILQRILVEGLVVGLLRRTGRRGEFRSAVPVPPRRLASRGGLLATQIADVPREVYLLLDELGVPWEVWERGHLLGGAVLSRLVLALREFGTSPFTVVEYANLVGIDPKNLASRDIRGAFLAGLVRREGTTTAGYAFRTTKDRGGWDALLRYGESTGGQHTLLLREALGIFGGGTFGIGELLEELGIGLSLAKRLLEHGKWTGLLDREHMSKYHFSPEFVDVPGDGFADEAPGTAVRRSDRKDGQDELTGVPGTRTIQDIWERNVERLHLRSQVLGSSMDVWNRAHLLKASTLGALVSLFEKFGLGPFGVGDYRGLTGVSEGVAVREMRSAVLAGVIERVPGTDGFAVRKTPGPSGWEALEEWDEGGLLYCLEEAFEEFGDGVFSAEEFRAFKGTLSRELFDGSSLDGLEEGLVSGVLERRPSGYGFAASPP